MDRGKYHVLFSFQQKKSISKCLLKKCSVNYFIAKFNIKISNHFSIRVQIKGWCSSRGTAKNVRNSEIFEITGFEISSIDYKSLLTETLGLKVLFGIANV